MAPNDLLREMSEREQSLAKLAADVPASAAAGRGRKRVLVVEDDAVMRLLLMSKLRAAGLEVDVASNGNLALKKLAGGQFDAIFLNPVLPDFQGVEVIQEARQDPKFASRPIYICTSALPASVSAGQATRAGATKVFHTTLRPIEAIVAEVAADLMGPGSTAALCAASPADQAESQALQAIAAKLKEDVACLCGHLKWLAHCNDEEVRGRRCRELWSKVHCVANSAAAAGMHSVAREAAALQGFLKELGEKPKRFTDSSLRTISSAVDALERVSGHLGTGKEAEVLEFTAVVVDEELFSRTATSNALRNVGFRLSTFADPAIALEYLGTHPADLIVLDLFLPTLSGLDLCDKLRDLPAHRKTPVIFVASPRDLKRSSRALSIRGMELVVRPASSRLALKALSLILRIIAVPRDPNGPSDTLSASAAELIVRPFISMELALKALSQVLKNQAQTLPTAPSNPAPIPPAKEPIASNQDPALRSSSSLSTEVSGVAGAKPEPSPGEADTSAPGPITGLPPGPDAGIPFRILKKLEAERALPPGADSADEATTLRGANEELLQQVQAITTEATLHHQASAKSQQEREQLLARICSDEVELHRAHTALDQGSEERKQLEQKLAELADSKADLETLANLRQSFDELSAKLTGEQQATAGFRRRSEELENRLRQNAADLERVKADAANQEQAQSDLRAQLNEAEAASEQSEPALQEEAGRNQRSEERLGTLCHNLQRDQTEHTRRFNDQGAGLRQVRDELQARLTAEQHAAAESTGRVEELENCLRDSAAEIERVKAELETQAAEQQRGESERCQQLSAAETLRDQLEAAWVEAEERNRRVKEELAGLRQIRDELGARLPAEQQAAAEAAARAEDLEGRLHENGTELERVKADLEKAGRNQRLEMKLVSLQQVRDALGAKRTAEQWAAADSRRRSEEIEHRLRDNAAELERLKADAEKHTEQQARLESGLYTQLNASQAAAAQAEASLKEKLSQRTQLENELASLRQLRDDFNGNLTAEQQAAAEAGRRSEELESRLRDNAAELLRLQAEADRHAEEKAHLESDLTAQLSAARAAAQQTRDELSGKLTAEQQVAAELRRRVAELESRLGESAAQPGHSQGPRQDQSGQSVRPQSVHRNSTDNPDGLRAQLSRLREHEAAHVAELAAMDRRMRETVASLARATADLEKERGERRRVEQRSASLAIQLQELHEDLRQHLESERTIQSRITDLEQQLRERDETAARTSADLQKETSERQLAEEQLRAVGDLRDQLRKYLSLFEESKKVFNRAQEELGSQLQAKLTALSESESKLQKEASERLRLEEALTTAQRNLHDLSQRSAIELSKLQSELRVEQLERKHLEGDAIQSRYSSLDSARVGRAMVDRFCKQIRQPVDGLMQLTRRLLEAELPDEQKKLVESVLENTLLLQTSLRESAAADAGSARAADHDQPQLDNPRPPGLLSDKAIEEPPPGTAGATLLANP